MKGHISTFLLAIVFCTQGSFADMCDDFKGAVSVETEVTEVSIKAEDQISIPVKITLNDKEVKKWKRINMSAGVFNAIVGSKSMFETYFIKNQDGELEIPKTLTFQTAKNMGGAYKLGVMIYAQDKSYPGPCTFNVAKVPNFKIEIKNDPEKIDINPPVVNNIRFKKTTYAAGDTLEVLFEAATKNEICSVWKAQNSRCETGTHVELKRMDGADAISFHTPTPVFKTKSKGIFLAVVPLSEEYATQDIKPGRYRLTHFMVKDLYGNFFNEVPAQTEVVVEFK